MNPDTDRRITNAVQCHLILASQRETEPHRPEAFKGKVPGPFFRVIHHWQRHLGLSAH
jgi:hypothetical protein